MAVAFVFLVLVASLVAISKGADLFIESGAGLGTRLGLKPYLIGSLIVGVGTSLPELVTSISALREGEPSLVAPNVYGTVIANVLLGLGCAAVAVAVLRSRQRTGGWRSLHLSGSHVDLTGANALDEAVPLAIFSVLLSLLVSLDGSFSRFDAALFLVCYLIFMKAELESVAKSESSPAEFPAGDESVSLGSVLMDAGLRRTLSHHLILLLAFAGVAVAGGSIGVVFGLRPWLVVLALGGLILIEVLMAASWLRRHPESSFLALKDDELSQLDPLLLVPHLVLSLVVVFVAGDLIVQTILRLSTEIGIEATVLTASVVALGTSLPDIVVAIKVALKGWHQMLIGHIVQSNVFDMLFIMGVCGLFGRLPIENQTLVLTIPLAVGVHLLLVVMLQDQRISASEGAFLAVLYVAYLGVLYG